MPGIATRRNMHSTPVDTREDHTEPSGWLPGLRPQPGPAGSRPPRAWHIAAYDTALWAELMCTIGQRPVRVGTEGGRAAASMRRCLLAENPAQQAPRSGSLCGRTPTKGRKHAWATVPERF